MRNRVINTCSAVLSIMVNTFGALKIIEQNRSRWNDDSDILVYVLYIIFVQLPIFFFIFRYIINVTLKSKIYGKLQLFVKFLKEVIIDLFDGVKKYKKSNKNSNQYNESKRTFKYYSNEKLLDVYRDMKNNNIQDFETLALEEELIDRQLLNHSEMHEKLHKLSKII